jgi:glyoxylase-like metal-dependent hydrolase (beta-lactamase superfamily II)
MLYIHKFVFNPFAENTYLIWDNELLETAIIDPGCSDSSEQKTLFNYIEKNNLKPKYLINTHCHIDHILGVNAIVKNYNVNYIIPEYDLPLLKHAISQAEMFGFRIDEIKQPDEFLSEDYKITLGKEFINCLFTPGHTPGEFCLYSEKYKFCITGDVLFKQSIGRTDLWGGDYDQLISSIKTKLLPLPDDVTIFPGHGETSTIGEEKKLNPFF